MKRYTFDAKLFASITVDAEDEASARVAVLRWLDDALLVTDLDGSGQRCADVTLDGELDLDEVADVPPPVPARGLPPLDTGLLRESMTVTQRVGRVERRRKLRG